ncbi:MAG: diacylglycerol kinase family protein [Patescibacteria group bacterium]
MPIINIKTLLKSIRYASRGIGKTWRNEQNFKIDVIAALIVVIFMIYFRINWGEIIVLTLMIILVMVLELINTAVEKMIDIVNPRLHDYAEAVKDILAGAVLIASIGALFVGVLIFYPYITGQK